MNRRFWFWIIALFLFLISVAGGLAIPPSQFSENGLQLAFPSFEYAGVSTALELPFHVYRVSDGVAQYSDVNCTLHVYDSVGNHIYVDSVNTPVNNFDYVFEINSSVFSSVGMYAFNAYCECESCSLQSSKLGGFVQHVFEISTDGRSPYRFPSGWLPVILGLAFFSLICFLTSTFVRSERLQLLKFGFFVLGLFNLFFLSLSLLLVVLNPSRVDLAKPVFVAYFGVMGFLIIAFLWLFGLSFLGRVKSMFERVKGGGLD